MSETFMDILTDKPKRGRPKDTIRRRSKDESSLSDSTCTPKWLADMLPDRDLDPCSNDRSHIRARWSFSLEKKLDGLKLPWMGTVYENWPYANPKPWAIKTMHELRIGNCTDAIVLCKLDGSTDWWDIITSWEPEALPDEPLHQPPDLWIFNDRIQFDEDPALIAARVEKYKIDLANYEAGRGKKPVGRADGKSSNNFCSAIIHHRHPRTPSLNLSSVAKLWWRAF